MQRFLAVDLEQLLEWKNYEEFQEAARVCLALRGRMKPIVPHRIGKSGHL